MTAQQTTVAAAAEQLPQLTGFLQQFWSAAALPAEACFTFELALEEIFMNVVMHGSADGARHTVELSLARADDGVTMTVADDGPGFDPLSLPSPDVTASLSDRPIGGLGIYLVRKMMDSVSYARADGRNRLSMSKRLGA